jgi:lipopolysaccharide export system protein LptA
MTMFNKFSVAIIAALWLSAAAHAQAFRDHNTKAPIDYSADRTEGLFREDRAVFSGNVIVRQGDLTLNADRINVAFADGRSKGAIERIDAAGGVTVRRGNESAQGSFAVYDPTRKLITLMGRVVLTQGASTVRGERLIIDLTSGRAVVDGAAQMAAGTTSTDGSGRVTGRFTVPDKAN